MIQSMPGDTCDRMCTCPNICKSPARAKVAMLKSLSAVQLHRPNRKFAAATETVVTVAYFFHNSASSCFILNETVDMLQ